MVGSGFTGLSAAWFLVQQGFRCVVIDENPSPGETIRTAYSDLPSGLLDVELRLLERSGVIFRSGTRIDGDAGLDALTREFPAVLLATGPASQPNATSDKQTMMTGREGVFLAGRAVRATAQPVGRVADGKAAAVCIHHLLC